MSTFERTLDGEAGACSSNFHWISRAGHEAVVGLWPSPGCLRWQVGTIRGFISEDTKFFIRSRSLSLGVGELKSCISRAPCNDLVVPPVQFKMLR